MLNDVCKILELSNQSDSFNSLDDDEKSGVDITDPHGRMQKTNVIAESGLYSLVLRSCKPEAKAFKRWITHEVLPTIRKTGSYGISPDLEARLEIAEAKLQIFEEHCPAKKIF